LEPIEITQEILDERDEYCSKKRFMDLVRENVTKKAMGFKEAFEQVCEEDPLMFLVHQLGGYPWGWQYLIYKHYIEQGNESRKELEICCSRQIGKALRSKETVITPHGKTEIGLLEEGDYVIGSDGKPSEVIGVYPQGKMDMYKVTFTDGSSVDCSRNHLWTVKGAGTKHWKVLSLDEMIKNRGMTPNSDNAYRIPLTEPVEFESKEIGFNPYFLGSMLGDGCMTRPNSLSIDSADQDLIDEALIDYDYTKTKSRNHFTYTFKGDDKIAIVSELDRLELLGCDSSTKFIPEEYKYNSVENRIELLRGLMDTDGSIYGNCVMEYSTVSERLKNDVKELVESLGGNVRVTKRKSHYKFNGVRKQTKDSYRMMIRLQNINPFKIERKASKWYNIKYKRHRIIKSIENLNEQDECVCIKVDNESETFLTSNYIVTHNTKIIVAPLEIWRCWFNIGWKSKQTSKNKSKNTVEGVTSATDEQAKNINDEIRAWIWSGDDYMSNYVDKKGKKIFGDKYFSSKIDWKKTTVYTITFKKGLGGSLSNSYIKSVPPTDKIRGNTYTGFVFDEKAFMERENYIVNSVAGPALGALGTSIIGVSTPNSKSGDFYERMDPDEMYDSHKAKRFMFEDYWNTVQEEIKDKLARGKAKDVAREYYCDFTSSDELFFDMEKVEQSIKVELKQYTELKGKKVIMGIDVGGKTKSHSVITLVTLPDYQGVSHRVACWRYPIMKDVNIIADVEREIFPNFDVVDIVIDYCAASRLLYDQMMIAGWTVKKFEFSKQSKIEFYDRFRSYISTQKLLTYEDRNLMLEFNNFTTDMKPKRGATDDMLDSWMLAASPILKETNTYEVHVIGGDDTKNSETDIYDDMLAQHNSNEKGDMFSQAI